MNASIDYEMLYEKKLLGAEEFQREVPKPGKDGMQELKITVKGLKLLIDDFLDEPKSEHRKYAKVSYINPHDADFQTKYKLEESTKDAAHKTDRGSSKSIAKLADEFSFKEILLSKKEKDKLNFFVMFDYSTMHSSLTINYTVNYSESNLYIDPLGICSGKWPPVELIGTSDKKSLFHENETFVMESCLQKDCFNCRSFCFEFIKSFTRKFENLKGDTQTFDKYIKTFFKYEFVYKTDDKTKLLSEKPKNEELFARPEKSFYRNDTLSLLPLELLKTCQSFSLLKILKSKILGYYDKQIETAKKLLLTNSESTDPKIIETVKSKITELKETIFEYEQMKESVETIYAELNIPEKIPNNFEDKRAMQEITKKREEHLERLQELLEKHKLQNEE